MLRENAESRWLQVVVGSILSATVPIGHSFTRHAKHFRMTSALFLIIATAIGGCLATDQRYWPRVDIFQPNFHQTQRYRDTRSVDTPTVEVLMHLPPQFKDVNAFKKFLGIRPERRRRDVSFVSRTKRQAAVPGSVEVGSPELLVQKEEDVPYAAELQVRRYPDAILELSQSRGMYASPLDTEDPRKRRNTSANDHEDKRNFPDPSPPTTTAPFWKQKKTSPPFVTQREGRGQVSYDLPQHRSMSESARESHSLKDKPLASNEIPRMQDNYYSASDPSTRRAYNSRQAETPPPKSVYDTMDYNNSRRGQGRNADSRGRLTTDSYSYTRSYSYPRPYDNWNRYYYPPGEVASRGVEYYHRTVDPGTGRLVYYASLPEPTPNYDPYSGRSLPGRAYTFDAYGRAYPTVPGYPYNPGFSVYNPADYLRSGRNTAEPYQRYEDRYRDEYRNKTYVIYDAEEKRTGLPNPLDDRNRYVPPVAYPPYTPPGYFGYPPPQQTFSYRNPYPPDVRGLVGGENPSREVLLPLTSRSASSSFDKQPIKPLKT